MYKGDACPALTTDGAQLDMVLAAAEIGIWDLDLTTGAAMRNLRHDQIFGYPDGVAEWTFEQFLGHVDPADRDRVRRLQEDAIGRGEVWSFETRIQRPDGSTGWISASGRPLKNEAGRTVKLIGHVIDITAIKLNEERMRLYASELGHRVGNMLAMISAMVRLSRHNATSVDEFSATVQRRIEALARTNRILTGEDTAPADVLSLVEAELLPFDDLRPRLTLTGFDRTHLETRTAEGFSLALHEILTNAIKHGALSVPEGRVTLEMEHVGTSELRITWTELDGPPVTPPTRIGFGTSILSSILGDGGRIERIFLPEGVVHVIELDVSGGTLSARPGTLSGADNLPPMSQQAADTQTRPKVLLVEDEALIAMDLADHLAERGIEVVGPCVRVSDALSKTDGSLSAALIDINLTDGTSLEVARRLRELNVPFAVISGRSPDLGATDAYGGAQILHKPVSMTRLNEVIESLLAGRGMRPARG